MGDRSTKCKQILTFLSSTSFTTGGGSICWNSCESNREPGVTWITGSPGISDNTFNVLTCQYSASFRLTSWLILASKRRSRLLSFMSAKYALHSLLAEDMPEAGGFEGAFDLVFFLFGDFEVYACSSLVAMSKNITRFRSGFYFLIPRPS
jgi:hypothetical protein